MGEPRICVVITAPDAPRAVEAIKRVIPQEPDLIEVRLDYMRRPGGLTRIRETTDVSLIATNRSREQGGSWGGDEEERVKVLLSACDAGFDYVDLELGMGAIKEVGEDARARGAKLIVSHHDWVKTPGAHFLRRIVRRELDAGADVCKIVGTARNRGDNLVYLRLLQENVSASMVCFGMGAAGTISRIISPLFGGAFTYASTNVGEESAPGQLTISDMRTIYKMLGV